MCGSNKRKEDIGTAGNSPKKRKRSLRQSPFLKLPPELCIQILRHLQQMISEKSFLGLRLVCRRMNSLIEENRNIFVQPDIKRVVVAQHDYFVASPKRFVMADPSKLPLSLDSCSHAEICLVLFFKVSLESYKVEEIIQSVRKNHIMIEKMVFYGVYLAACEAHLVIQLLKTAGVESLLMVECKLSRNLEETFRQLGHSSTTLVNGRSRAAASTFWSGFLALEIVFCRKIRATAQIYIKYSSPSFLVDSFSGYNSLNQSDIHELECGVFFDGNSHECKLSGGYKMIADDPWIYNFLQDQKDTDMWSHGIGKRAS